jgi:hypothetical protein
MEEKSKKFHSSIDEHIFNLFVEKKELIFSQIYHNLHDCNFNGNHDQKAIALSLKRLIKMGYLEKIQTEQSKYAFHTHPHYRLLIKKVDS